MDRPVPYPRKKIIFKTSSNMLDTGITIMPGEEWYIYSHGLYSDFGIPSWSRGWLLPKWLYKPVLNIFEKVSGKRLRVPVAEIGCLLAKVGKYGKLQDISLGSRLKTKADTSGGENIYICINDYESDSGWFYKNNFGHLTIEVNQLK
jgi:hypothetical protein